MQTHEPAEKTYDLERLIFFTDGVFAIVITLLVLELRPPDNWDRTLAGLWAERWRALLAYAVSFLAVGGFWNAHRRLFGMIVRFRSGLVIFNLLLMGLVVLLPFAAELIFDTGATGEPFLIYLGLITAIGAAQALLWGFAAYVARVVDARVTARSKLMILLTMLLAPALLSAAGYFASRSNSPNVWLGVIPVVVAIALIRRRLMTTHHA